MSAEAPEQSVTPPHAEQFQRALAHFQQGKSAEALTLCSEILLIAPNHGDALHLSGMVHAQSGNLALAAPLLKKTLGVDPDNAAAHANYGNVLSSMQRFDEAIVCYDRAIALLPSVGDFHAFRGNALRKAGRFEESVIAYDQAIALNPGEAETHCNRAIALKELRRYDLAVAGYDAALRLSPASVSANANRGVALAAMSRHEAAISSLQRARELAPQIPFVHLQMGISLHAIGQFDAAIESYQAALALNASNADAHHNLGISLLQLRQHESALQSFERAIAIHGQLADAHVNRGLVLAEMDKHLEARASYEQAITINPALRIAHRNLSHLYLQLGEYDKGWEKLEWRLVSNDNKPNQRLLPQPLWLGRELIAGKTILLHSEQGLGDTLQFSRYARHVSALGARVILEVQQPLLNLLAGLDGVMEVISQGTTPPAFDFHCPLMSLPLALKNSIGSAPATCTPIQADSAKVEEWQARLGNKTRPRIGFAWRGNPQHKNDRNRSIPLADFTNLLSSDFEFICLQKEMTDVERRMMTCPDILLAGEYLRDFSDTAALCEALDLIITVDTSVAHLAGSMGKPVWILLPFNPDWRWMLERTDTPWYPSARLYRSDRHLGWTDVIEKVCAYLAQWAKSGETHSKIA